MWEDTMQFQFRVDDDNFLTFDIQLQRAMLGASETRAELVAATLSDSKLSNLAEGDILDIGAQIVDMLTTSAQSQSPSADWFNEEWLPATRGTDGAK